MRKSEPERVFHPPRWIASFLSVVALALAVATVHFCRSQGLSLEFAVTAALGLLTVLGVADGLTTSVRLYSDSLFMMSKFRRRILPRAELDHVTWEVGVGVSLRLKSGRWVKLPDVGNSQSVTNPIRAWLKRSPGSA
jgi:hypothetical protein